MAGSSVTIRLRHMNEPSSPMWSEVAQRSLEHQRSDIAMQIYTVTGLGPDHGSAPAMIFRAQVVIFASTGSTAELGTSNAVGNHISVTGNSALDHNCDLDDEGFTLVRNRRRREVIFGTMKREKMFI